jgi:Fe-S-cluster containining protein
MESLGCARCGDCCERIWLSLPLDDLAVWSTDALSGVPDPSTDEGWEYWLEHGWVDRELAVQYFDPQGSRRANADFLSVHWHPIPEGDHSCDQFDPVHRVCLAHDGRPPVCSGYPWYGSEPSVARAPKRIAHCSYLADLPPADRPEGSRPLIPLEVL